VSEASNPQLPIIVQSLVGRISLPFYLRCLQSLLEHCEEKISLLIHEDGSLQENDREQARRQLGENTNFIDLAETKERTLDQLSGHPYCQAIRKDSLWGIEFFDPLFAHPDDPISYYIDADILFLRPFFGLFEPKKVEGGALFLRDIQWDAYCLRPWHLFGFGMRPVIVKGITTALVCWDKRAIDWDYLEWFLSQNKFHRIPEWVMPTAQAGLAKRCQARVVSPSQLPNLYPNASIDKETFGVHLLGSYRDDWRPKVESYAKEIPSDQSPVQASFEPCQSRGTFAYGINQAKRWVNTRLNQW
jgi:hypothetical protein